MSTESNTPPSSPVLLPVGTDGLFFGMTPADGETGKINFAFDATALPFVFSEMVRQGATGLATDPTGKLSEIRSQLPAALRRRVHVLDRRGRIRRQVNRAFGPMAAELGFNPDEVDLVDDPFVGPQRHVLDLPPPLRPVWSDLLLAHSSTFQLLLGIDSQVQVDIPLRKFKEAVQSLRRTTKDPTSLSLLGFLSTLADSYSPYLLGSASPMTSVQGKVWVETFKEFVEDVAYQEYAHARSELGYVARAEAATERSWALARRMLRSKTAKGLLKFSVTSAASSAGMPANPPDLFSEHFERSHYLPPLIRTTSQLARARQIWLDANPSYTGALTPGFEHFGWLASESVPSLVVARVQVDREWFSSLFTTEPPLDLTETCWQRALERYFAVNLEAPPLCPNHGIELNFDDVSVSWAGREIEMTITCCCEEAGRAGFISMCAFRSDRRRDYAEAINEEVN